MKIVVLKEVGGKVTLIEDLLLEDSLLLGKKKITGSVRNVGAENIGLKVSGKTESMVQSGLNPKFVND